MNAFENFFELLVCSNETERSTSISADFFRDRSRANAVPKVNEPDSFAELRSLCPIAREEVQRSGIRIAFRDESWSNV